MTKHHRKLMVVGCPRSGTKFMAATMRKIKLDILHEANGADGTSSWMFAARAEKYPFFPWEAQPRAHVGEKRDEFEYDQRWHQVRHPLKTVGSVALVLGSRKNFQWQWIAEQLDDPYITEIENDWLRSMRFVYKWNLLEKETEWRYRLEDLDERWPEMMQRLGMPPCPVPKTNRTMNHAKRRPKWTKLTKEEIERNPTWDELRLLDPLLAKKLKGMAERYGYQD